MHVRPKTAIAGATCVLIGMASVGIAIAQQSDDPVRPPARGDKPADAQGLYAGLGGGDAATVDGSYRSRAVTALVETDPDLDPSTFRLLRREPTANGDLEMYAAAGTTTICTITRHWRDSNAIASSGCGQARDASGRPIVHDSVQYDADNTFLVGVLVPDGVRDLDLQFVDGKRVALSVVNSVALYHGEQRPSRLTYTLPDGSSMTDDYSLESGPGDAGG
jgi:hypothetical protein